MKVVVDTNVIVSAHLRPEGWEGQVFRLVLASRISMCISTAIFAEYARVLSYPRLRLDPDGVHVSLQTIRDVSVFVVPSRDIQACAHAADNRFLECADACDPDFSSDW